MGSSRDGGTSRDGEAEGGQLLGCPPPIGPPHGGGVSTGVGMPAEGNRALLSGQTKPRCVPQCPALCQAVLWQGLAVPGAGNTAGLGVPRASHSAPSTLQKPDLQGC